IPKGNILGAMRKHWRTTSKEFNQREGRHSDAREALYVAGARRPIPKRFLVEAIEAKLLAITGQSRKRHAKRAVQVKAKLLRSLCQVEDLASHLEERSLCNQS